MYLYMRNVINEHTRELSRTTEEGGEEQERKRVKKQKMYNEKRGQGKYAGEDLL